MREVGGCIERSRQRDEGRGWGVVANEKQQMESDWERVRGKNKNENNEK